jgi:hypothetical protein
MATFSTLRASFGSFGGVKTCLLEFFWQCPDVVIVEVLKNCFCTEVPRWTGNDNSDYVSKYHGM